MSQSLRAFAPGGTFFFTVTLLKRRQKLLTGHIDDIRAVFKAARQRRPCTVEAKANFVRSPALHLDVVFRERKFLNERA